MANIPGIHSYFVAAKINSYFSINSRNQICLYLGGWGPLPGIY